MRARSVVAAVALAAAVSSCSDEVAPVVAPPDQRADLGGDVIARVSGRAASEAVSKSVVPRVANELGIPPDEAARRLVDDAVAAVAARDRGLDAKNPTSWALRSARARFVLAAIRAEARAKGPPTDAEIEELTGRHWRQVDRPEAARVVQVAVLRSDPPNPELDARAKALAEELRAVLAAVSTREEFLAKAKAFPHPNEIKVQADELPAMTDDGWNVEGPGNFDETFAKAASALAEPGDTSPVVETEKFGWHVIRLVEKVPEQRMPLESRRLAFTEEAYSVRARKALEAVLTPLRAANPVTIEPTADPLMRSVMASDE